MALSAPRQHDVVLPAPRRGISRRAFGAAPTCILGSDRGRQQKGSRELSDNPVVQLVVGVATEALRLAGVGQGAAAAALPPGPSSPPPKGDVEGVLKAIRADYEQRAYFITGVLSDGIYDEDCYFADPTVKFKGRELWKRNLQLLVPFLEEPSIALKSTCRLHDAPPAAAASSTGTGGAVLRADWLLTTCLRLPWRPYIVVNGSTEYSLSWPDNNRVVSHVEEWDISGWEALVQVLTPGDKRREAARAKAAP